MKYDLRKPTVWAVKLGIRVGIFYACKQEKSQEKFERDFDESCSNFKNHMERKKEEQK